MRNLQHRPRRFAVALLIAALVAGLAMTATATPPAAWSADAAHTEINFSVNHFFTPVTGSFEDHEVHLDYDALNPENSRVNAKIRVSSINTGNEKRDNHLRSADWFEAEKHPYITFESTSVRQVGDSRLLARGPLTIKGQSREVELPISLLGSQPIPVEMRPMLGGTQEVASFQATASIERGDFGVGVGSWAATMVVGSEVDINILLEAHRK